ncbi:Alpha/Beta hydrolase protein [Apodospora peruviana]|uniref:Alpha/Beta hydrolase protein n=1 Tax=Apodospora peruviana TaxID=516989 RepID=A0AAE0IQW3_9PEZI|nr:Alpha/Beta hydrolase protein [Apodospora peruviana]
MAAVIRPARLISQTAHLLPGQLHVTELFFEVPKNYSRPELGTLKLFGRSVRRHERPIVPMSRPEQEAASKSPYLVYLEGGPGFGNREPQDSPLTRPMLSRGYQLLFLDYRGTGLSTPINTETIVAQGDPQEQANYLKLFRADNIVRDCEAVRLCLTAGLPEENKPWSLFGQSFGGFVSLTYLSKYPKGLREVFMTGGLAPINSTAEEVYRATYKKVIERNEAYYRKFPEDVNNVYTLVEYIENHEGGGPQLPGGGVLTVGRLLSVGLSFGAHGGLDTVHALILRLTADLDQFGVFTRGSLAAIEGHIPFDTNPIYAILHESIYCYKKGVASNWAAYRVGKELPPFPWLWKDSTANSSLSSSSNSPPTSLVVTKFDGPPCFSGEMVYPLHFQSYPELRPMEQAAHILAKCNDWDELYDEEQLSRNEVPVYAASFIDDMYVDIELARMTAGMVKGCKVFETNMMYHNAVRAHTDEVISQLFKMRDDTID